MGTFSLHIFSQAPKILLAASFHLLQQHFYHAEKLRCTVEITLLFPIARYLMDSLH